LLCHNTTSVITVRNGLRPKFEDRKYVLFLDSNKNPDGDISTETILFSLFFIM